MKQFGFFLIGFFAALLSLSLFSFIGSSIVLFLYGAALYCLFFTSEDIGAPLLLGYALGLELLGTHRFGLVMLCSLVAYGSHLLFGLQLRFTSLTSRFIVALLMCLTAVSFILYPLIGIGSRVIMLGLVCAFVGGASVLLRRAAEPNAYELL